MRGLALPPLLVGTVSVKERSDSILSSRWRTLR
jgi:hypothetical protein